MRTVETATTIYPTRTQVCSQQQCCHRFELVRQIANEVLITGQ